jgi:hypothetical protein
MVIDMPAELRKPATASLPLPLSVPSIALQLAAPVSFPVKLFERFTIYFPVPTSVRLLTLCELTIAIVPVPLKLTQAFAVNDDNPLPSEVIRNFSVLPAPFARVENAK